MPRLCVELPTGTYAVHIGAGILDIELPALLRSHPHEQIVAITNETLQQLYPQRISRSLQSLGARVETIVLADGELQKRLTTVAHIYDQMMHCAATRETVVVAFGGGVVGDIAGFAAATFMRGVPLVQVPTTLLACVDSSIGGKTGVNHALGKNAIGAFHQPLGVVIDRTLWRTLPEREWRAGLAELVKHAILGDRALFDNLLAAEAHRLSSEDPFWDDALTRSCAVKCRIVAADEKEQAQRVLLNFGHTLAHLMETHMGYQSILHGEAVALGMLYAAWVSQRWGVLAEEELRRVRALLEPIMRPLRLPYLDAERFQQLLLRDKKNRAQGLRFVALRAPGEAFVRENVPVRSLWPLFQEFCSAFPQLVQIDSRAQGIPDASPG